MDEEFNILSIQLNGHRAEAFCQRRLEKKRDMATRYSFTGPVREESRSWYWMSLIILRFFFYLLLSGKIQALQSPGWYLVLQRRYLEVRKVSDET
jgi:hypothetical protein